MNLSNPKHFAPRKSGRGVTPRWFVCALALIAAGGVAQSSRADEPPIDLDNNWWDRAVDFCSLYIVTDCAITRPGWHVDVAMPLKGFSAVCCSDKGLTIQTGQTISYTGEASGTYEGACAKFAVKFSATNSFTSMQTIPMATSKCGCTIPVVHARYYVYEETKTCQPYISLNPLDAPMPFRTKRQKRIPLIPEIRPVTYPSPKPCPDCPTPPRFDQQSQPGTTTDIRPWDTERDGPTPDQAGAFVDTRQLPSIEVDMTEFFEQRGIASTLDLNLFEIRSIVQELRYTNAMPPVAGSPSSRATIIMGKSMRLDGRAGSLEARLRKNAVIMVSSSDYGDFNQDGLRDGDDIILLQDAILRGNLKMSENRLYDIDGDGSVTQDDLATWLRL